MLETWKTCINVSYQNMESIVLYKNLSLASLLRSFLTRVITTVPVSGILWCSSWRLEFSREFQQPLNKAAVTLHTGYFPNVRAYGPINCVSFVIRKVNFNSEKMTRIVG